MRKERNVRDFNASCLYALLLFCFPAFALDLNSDPDPRVTETLNKLDQLLAKKQVEANYALVLSLLKSSNSERIQYRAADALTHFVAPVVRDDLIALLENAKETSVTRRTAIWMGLLAQYSLVTDAHIKRLLAKTGDHNFTFELAGKVNISVKTREQILEYAQRKEPFWCGSVTSFIRIELGKHAQHKLKKQLSLEDQGNHLDILNKYTGEKFPRSAQRDAAFLLIEIGEKSGFSALANVFEEELRRLKNKKKPIEGLFSEVDDLYGVIGKKLEIKEPADENQREEVIVNAIAWLRDHAK